MVGATVLGVFLQGLPPDRRVAMARVASLIRRAARGVRESKRFGLVFYELNGGPLFGLESREKSLTLYIAEKSVIEPFISTMKGIDAEHSLIEFTDLNRLPLPDIEKLCAQASSPAASVGCPVAVRNSCHVGRQGRGSRSGSPPSFAFP